MKECVDVKANSSGAIHLLKVYPAANVSIHDFVQGNQCRKGGNLYHFQVGTARPKQLDEALAR